MKKINCLIVEDEPLAADLIADYASQLPFLELLGKATSATEAIACLRSEKIDLMFLDLHLPGLKGFELLKTLSLPPKVIVTTAYHQYALESYEFAVIDYLLKPISFERFLKAINKIDIKPIMSHESVDGDLEVDQTLILKEGRSNVPVLESDILYIEGQKDYLIVHTKKLSVKTKSTLVSLQERLSHNKFIRIHKSFIVRKSQVISFNSKCVQLADKALPVGRNYVEALKASLSASPDQ